MRFIATSATLGHGAEAERQLRRFLAGLAGMDESRIDVVTGSRYVPPLDGDFGGLTANPAARRLRETLAEGPATLGCLQAAQPDAPVCDLLERGIMPSGPNGAAFLPLRLHLFHRAQSGMFACLDPACTGRQGTRLDHPDWPYGKVFERDRERCDACGARTLEVLLCDDCGAPFLEAGLDAGERQLDRWREEQSLDEFALEADEDGDEGEDGDASAPPLQPAGFAVDPDAPVTNAVEYVNFVPPPRPLVSAAGAPWVALSNPNIGRFRRSPDGVVMAMSRGTHGHGYAVCLSCGRAAAETGGPGPVLPPARSLVGHKPLRKRRETMRCDGNDRTFSIQRHLAFGFSRRTEVFELQLADMPGEDVALTLAVALREALCHRIGIERDEVACDAGYAGDGEVCSIWLFDTAAGGAGYAAATTVDVAGLLRDARGALECSNSGCERACPACLILRDTVRFAGRLDRKAAAA